jgi:hypothetical protein
MPREKLFFPVLNGATVDRTVALSLMHEFEPLEWGKGWAISGSWISFSFLPEARGFREARENRR